MVYLMCADFRRVAPYTHTVSTYAKGRWVGRSIGSVFAQEFKLDHIAAIQSHSLTVNNLPTHPGYILRNSDCISHTQHRHEPPVTANPVQIVFESETVLVVSKPGSIPVMVINKVHATGKYMHNTLIGILQNEHGQGVLHAVNRLDRLTSGLCILAKDRETAARLMGQVKLRLVEKVYLAKVQGLFPDKTESRQRILSIVETPGVNIADPSGKECHTRFERIGVIGTESLVRCYPITGRTHQIRVHLQHMGFPIVNDPVYGSKPRPRNDATLPDSILANTLITTYPSTDTINKENSLAQNNLISTQKVMDAIIKKDTTKTDSVSNSLIVINCHGCLHPRADPAVNEYICLHALTYKGHDWNYQTALPSWAKGFGLD